jgi:hypothetical protein
MHQLPRLGLDAITSNNSVRFRRAPILKMHNALATLAILLKTLQPLAKIRNTLRNKLDQLIQKRRSVHAILAQTVADSELGRRLFQLLTLAPIRIEEVEPDVPL